MYDPQAFTLRAMTEADLDSVLKIEQDAQYHPWKKAEFERSLKSNRKAWVIEFQSNGAIAAFAVFGLLVGECELLTIATATDFRRQGLAKELIQQAQQTLKAETIYLEVRESNAQAIELYESLGFNEIGCRKNYYPAANNQKEDALIYALSCF